MLTKDVKILIVEDDEDIREMLEYNLVKEGYLVYTANDGTDGIKRAHELFPEIIILDVMMPGLNGVEVCENLRSNDNFSDTLITFLTARGEDFTQISCFEAGGDDFITKPIKPKVLMSRLKALLKRKNSGKAAEADILKFDDLEIDKEKVSVKKDGKTLTLAKKEYEILVLLSSKPGKVYTRHEIFNHVWGNEVIVGDRTIDVHIRRLREKIGENLIKTIKGMGYKFEF